jgi:hypothetical protein
MKVEHRRLPSKKEDSCDEHQRCQGGSCQPSQQTGSRHIEHDAGRHVKYQEQNRSCQGGAGDEPLDAPSFYAVLASVKDDEPPLRTDDADQDGGQ